MIREKITARGPMEKTAQKIGSTAKADKTDCEYRTLERAINLEYIKRG